MPRGRDITTPVGEARLDVHPAAGPARGTLVLGHGAGGASWGHDLDALAGLADDGWTVVRVVQPWRIAGRKVAAPPAHLDTAWCAAVPVARAEGPGPYVVGGRSAGARVACRTALDLGADAVLALSFPLHPPGRPEASRAAELAAPVAAGLPVLVVQGRRDPFGAPAEITAAVPGLRPVEVDAAHSPGTAAAARIRDAVADWLTNGLELPT